MQFHSKDLSELDELTEEQLGFSALSDGLGFSKKRSKAPANFEDDFDSDEDKKAMSLSGTGAVSAGMARPIPGYATSGKNNVTTVRNRAMPASAMAAYAPMGASIPTATKPAPNPLQVPAASQPIRAAAFAVDMMVILIPLSFAWWASFGSDSLSLLTENFSAPFLLFYVIFGSYFLLSESFGGQSLGKMLFHLRVVEDDKYEKPTGLSHALLRLLLLTAGIALAGIGLLFSFRDPKRRPWQDIYSGSIVRRKD